MVICVKNMSGMEYFLYIFWRVDVVWTAAVKKVRCRNIKQA